MGMRMLMLMRLLPLDNYQLVMALILVVVLRNNINNRNCRDGHGNVCWIA